MKKERNGAYAFKRPGKDRNSKFKSRSTNQTTEKRNGVYVSEG
jgi:hypothetical protein